MLLENGKSPEKKEDIEVKEEINHNTSNDTSKDESKENVLKEDKTEDEGHKSRSASPEKYVVFYYNSLEWKCWMFFLTAIFLI